MKTVALVLSLTLVVGVAVYTRASTPMQEGVGKSLNYDHASEVRVIGSGDFSTGNSAAPTEAYGMSIALLEAFPSDNNGDSGKDKRPPFQDIIDDLEKMREEFDKKYGAGKYAESLDSFKKFWDTGNGGKSVLELSGDFQNIIDLSNKNGYTSEEEFYNFVGPKLTDAINNYFGKNNKSDDPDRANSVRIYNGPSGFTFLEHTHTVTIDGRSTEVTEKLLLDFKFNDKVIDDKTQKAVSSIGIGTIISTPGNNGLPIVNFGLGVEYTPGDGKPNGTVISGFHATGRF